LLLHFSDFCLGRLASTGGDGRFFLLFYIRIDSELVAINPGLTCGGSYILWHLLHFQLQIKKRVRGTTFGGTTKANEPVDNAEPILYQPPLLGFHVLGVGLVLNEVLDAQRWLEPDQFFPIRRHL
jgi:hypothetical protein